MFFIDWLYKGDPISWISLMVLLHVCCSCSFWGRLFRLGCLRRCMGLSLSCTVRRFYSSIIITFLHFCDPIMQAFYQVHNQEQTCDEHLGNSWYSWDFLLEILMLLVQKLVKLWLGSRKAYFSNFQRIFKQVDFWIELFRSSFLQGISHRNHRLRKTKW